MFTLFKHQKVDWSKPTQLVFRDAGRHNDAMIYGELKRDADDDEGGDNSGEEMDIIEEEDSCLDFISSLNSKPLINDLNTEATPN